MKKAFSYVLRVVPALFLIFALVLSCMPVHAAAEIDAVDWFDYIDTLYQADFAYAGALVNFGHDDIKWVYSRSDTDGFASFNGASAEIRTYDIAEIFPFGDRYLDLKEVPLGTDFSFEFFFETDTIYSSLEPVLFGCVRYYDEAGNYVGLYRTDDIGFSFNDPGYQAGTAEVTVSISLDGVLDQSDGTSFMPRYAHFQFYLCDTSNIPILASLSSFGTSFVLDGIFQKLLTEDRMIALKNKLFFVLTEQQEGIIESGLYDWYSITLGSFFSVINGPSDIPGYEPPDDLPSLLDDLLSFIHDGISAFRSYLESANTFITGAVASLVAVKWLFDVFIRHPFILSSITIVLVFAAIALFFSMDIPSGKNDMPKGDPSQKRLTGKTGKKRR